MSKPKWLFHGSSQKVAGALRPVLKNGPNYLHNKPIVFAAERADIAAMFMLPESYLCSICFERDIAFICIWGKPEDFKDQPGYLYIFNSDQFQKVGKDYEWQSLNEVKPVEVKTYVSVIEGMLENGVQVYFIDDNPLFDQIRENIDHRAPIVKNLVSENQKREFNIKTFN